MLILKNIKIYLYLIKQILLLNYNFKLNRSYDTEIIAIPYRYYYRLSW